MVAVTSLPLQPTHHYKASVALSIIMCGFPSRSTISIAFRLFIYHMSVHQPFCLLSTYRITIQIFPNFDHFEGSDA